MDYLSEFVKGMTTWKWYEVVIFLLIVSHVVYWPIVGLDWLMGGALERWATVACTRLHRRLFPMTPARFRRYIGRAVKDKLEFAARTVTFTQEASHGLSAVIRVTDISNPEYADRPPAVSKVLVTYLDGVFQLCCRTPCPPPGGFPEAGQDGDRTWAVIEDGGGHHLVVTKTQPEGLVHSDGFAKEMCWFTDGMRYTVEQIGQFREALALDPAPKEEHQCLPSPA